MRPKTTMGPDEDGHYWYTLVGTPGHAADFDPRGSTSPVLFETPAERRR